MRRGIAWLHGELPALVDRGVLSADAAEALRRHYGPPDTVGVAGRLGQILLASIGALLVGGGIILILAHNWEDLGRPARAALALGMLVAAQGLAIYAALRRASSTPWIESTSALLVAAIGAAIALVGQTYHVGGSFEDLMRGWLWLALPILPDRVDPRRTLYKVKTEPVEPADPFRGRYVAIRPAVTLASPSAETERVLMNAYTARALQNGELNAYVVLSADADGFARAEAIVADPPRSGAYLALTQTDLRWRRADGMRVGRSSNVRSFCRSIVITCPKRRRQLPSSDTARPRCATTRRGPGSPFASGTAAASSKDCSSTARRSRSPLGKRPTSLVRPCRPRRGPAPATSHRPHRSSAERRPDRERRRASARCRLW